MSAPQISACLSPIMSSSENLLCRSSHSPAVAPILNKAVENRSESSVLSHRSSVRSGSRESGYYLSTAAVFASQESLRLEDGDAHNSALDLVRELYNSLPDLPEPGVKIIPGPLLEDIIWMHLRSQTIRRLFELRLVCKHFQVFLTDPKLLHGHAVREWWMLKHNCVRRIDNAVTLDMYDVQLKNILRIPVPAHIDSRRSQPGLISTDKLIVSSSQGGESGLVYLEKRGFSISDSPNCCSLTRECFVFNPMTKSTRQLHLDWSVRQVDRFGSRYLSWASSGGEELLPLLLDSVTDTWNRIGSGFTTRGPIRKDKAVVNDVVHQRYQNRRRDLKDQLIIYDMHQETFREESTTGLPDNLVDEHLFEHEGHIYLAAVQCCQPTAWKCVLLYELKSTNSELNWEKVGEMPAPLLHEVTTPYPALNEMKFFYVDQELLVASFVAERRSDGAHVFFRGARRCLAIVAYDLTSHSWRKDNSSRLGPGLHVSSTIFRPRLDIEA